MYTKLSAASADLKKVQDQLQKDDAESKRITIDHAVHCKAVADAVAELSARLYEVRGHVETCNTQMTERTALQSTAVDAIERLEADRTRYEAAIAELRARLDIAGTDLAIRTQELDDCTEHRATAHATITRLQEEIESHGAAMTDLPADLELAE